MDSLGQKLNEILSSPEKLEQVMKIAGEFLGSSPETETAEASAVPAAAAPNDDPSDTVSALLSTLGSGSAPGTQSVSPAVSASGSNADMVSSLLSMLGNAPGIQSTQSTSSSSGGGLDPKLMSMVMQVMNIFGKDDDRIRLLKALKPHLRSERAERIDRAVQILRVSEAVRTAIHSLTGGERNDVLKV